jgi:hypothetical protein
MRNTFRFFDAAKVLLRLISVGMNLKGLMRY